MVTIRLPAPSSMLVANVVAILGLAAVVLAVGGLAGLWWAVLVGGLVLVGLAAVALTQIVAEQAPAAPVSAAAAPVSAAAGPVAVVAQKPAA